MGKIIRKRKRDGLVTVTIKNNSNKNKKRKSNKNNSNKNTNRNDRFTIANIIPDNAELTNVSGIISNKQYLLYNNAVSLCNVEFTYDGQTYFTNHINVQFSPKCIHYKIQPKGKNKGKLLEFPALSKHYKDNKGNTFLGIHKPGDITIKSVNSYHKNLYYTDYCDKNTYLIIKKGKVLPKRFNKYNQKNQKTQKNEKKSKKYKRIIKMEK